MIRRSFVVLSIVLCIGSLVLWIRSPRVSDELTLLTRADTRYVLATHPQGIDLDVITNFSSHPPTWNPDSPTPPKEGWAYSIVKWGMAEEPPPRNALPNPDAEGDGVTTASFVTIYEWNPPEHAFAGIGYGSTAENWSYSNGVHISRKIIQIALPFWLVVPPLAIPGLLAWRRTILRRIRLRTNRCISCGYDLRGSPARCPECGRAGPGRIAAPVASETQHQPS